MIAVIERQPVVDDQQQGKQYATIQNEIHKGLPDPALGRDVGIGRCVIQADKDIVGGAFGTKTHRQRARRMDRNRRTFQYRISSIL